MITRRTFLALAAVATLTACADRGQLLEADLASTLKVTEVRATTTVKRTETALPKADIVEAARAKVAATLAASNPSGTRAVRVDMVVSQFLIANPVAGAVFGTRQSSISTQMTLVDVATGMVLKEPFRLVGMTEPRPTIIGAAAIKAPAVELETITTDLAAKAKVALYGN